MPIPSLIGVIHLPPLPGSPLNALPIHQIVELAVHQASSLSQAGFPALIVENYGDVPFFPSTVPPITTACMTACVCAIRESQPSLTVGVNVLRNDASAALAVAVACNASFVRINVQVGAKVTDQGIVQTNAHGLLRERSALRAQQIKLACDVDVKHAAPLGARNIADEAEDLVERALCDVVLVTGRATGDAVSTDHLRSVRDRVSVPVFAASGVTASELSRIVPHCDGVVVGSALRQKGKAGQPLDDTRISEFMRSFEQCCSNLKP